MYLFPNKGSQSQAGFGCVLVVGSSDQAHFSGMALGDTVRSMLHPLLPAPPPRGTGDCVDVSAVGREESGSYGLLDEVTGRPTTKIDSFMVGAWVPQATTD
jgi:hypothetical protein